MDTIELRVKTVLADVLDNGVTAGEIGSTADLVEQYGLDSLQMISFLLGIEDEFGVPIDYENLDLDELRSVARFVRYLRPWVDAAAVR